jgi:hypothetical protein
VSVVFELAYWKQTAPELAPLLLHPPEFSPPGISELQALTPPGAVMSETELATSEPVLKAIDTAVRKPLPAPNPVGSTTKKTSYVLSVTGVNVEVAV